MNVERNLLLTSGNHSKLLSCVQLCVTPWTAVCQAPPSLGFSRQEYWSGLPFPSPGDLRDPVIEPGSLTLYSDSLPSEPPGKSPSLLKNAQRIRIGGSVQNAGHRILNQFPQWFWHNTLGQPKGLHWETPGVTLKCDLCWCSFTFRFPSFFSEWKSERTEITFSHVLGWEGLSPSKFWSWVVHAWTCLKGLPQRSTVMWTSSMSEKLPEGPIFRLLS